MTRVFENIKVGVSIGDLNGIGSEVVLKTFEDSRMLEFCTPIIFANAKLISYFLKVHGVSLHYNVIDDVEQVVAGKINILNVWKENVNIEFGKENRELGKYAILSFKQATQALKEGKIDVLVTAPINKYVVDSEEFKFVGHTQYLSQELEGEALMLLMSEELKVALVTEHIPVKEIASKLNSALIRSKIELLEKTLVQDFGIARPKIAVLGLNPHNGDNGIIGKEEQVLITPLLKKMFEEGHFVFGPFASDGFFGNQMHKEFDAILAMYHDQGLVPFKTISFGMGVNYTAGLDRVRTSPDHGTAFDIAGKRKADCSSFREAVFRGIEIYKTRQEYNKISGNPLKVVKGQSEEKKERLV
ncbi:MAG: 4-hydroxythreonine-4-phosphate dehydrogenase PdxA [Bacteroidota bacterium]|nr:4-hydroxythreonine-4-phosphate dehydrogenase PdxA [Bacteroidota bacterium]